MSFFSGKRVLGHCEADLFFMWWLIHTLDDSFSEAHPVRSDQDLLKTWLSFINALDDAFSSSFFSDGAVSDFLVFFLGDFHES